MAGLEILALEDDAINALVLTQMLNKYVVHLAYRGPEAVEMAKASCCQLLLLDINLGDSEWDGVRVLQLIRTIPAYAHVPAIAVTGYALPADRERFLMAGFNGVVPKPIDEAQLLDVIQQLLPACQPSNN